MVLGAKYNLKDAVVSLEGSTFFGYYDRPIENNRGDFIVINRLNSETFLYVFSTDLDALFKVKLLIWNYQQGVLATWLNDEEIIFNTIINEKIVAYIHNIVSKKSRYLGFPLQSVSSDGRLMCSIDMGVLREIGTEYSYEMCCLGAFSKNKQKLIVVDIGSNSKFEVDYSRIKKIAFGEKNVEKFHVNHCVFSPSGNYLIFLSRGWENGNKLHTLMCLNISSKELFPVITDEIVSHYNWLSDDELVFWGTKLHIKSYHLVKVADEGLVFVKTLKGDFSSDGHPIFLSNSEFITDTYPNRARFAELKKISFAQDLTTNVEVIAELKQPLKFYGGKRVDLHPRTNSNGAIYVDSAHSGTRRLYKIAKSK